MEWLALFLVADAVENAAGIDPGLAQLVSGLGISGILAWYLFHHTKYALPEMLRAFAAEQKEAREAHERAQERMREAFDRALARVQEVLERVQEAANRARMQDIEAHAREMAETRGMINTLIQSLRVAVHDMRGTGQQVINAAALAVETQKQKNGGQGG